MVTISFYTAFYSRLRYAGVTDSIRFTTIGQSAISFVIQMISVNYYQMGSRRSVGSSAYTESIPVAETAPDGTAAPLVDEANTK